MKRHSEAPDSNRLLLSIEDKLLLSALLPTAASQQRSRQLVECHATLDWQSVLRRAESQMIAPLVRFNLVQAGLFSHLPLPIQQQFNQTSHTWAARHLAYTSEASSLIRALSDAGITAIPLKGAALMLGEVYPQAGLRNSSDMDVLVAPEQISQAEMVAARCGYLAKLDPNASPEMTAQIQRAEHRLPNELNHAEARRGRSGLVLELHRRAFHHGLLHRDFGFTEMIEGAIRQTARTGETLLLPAPEELALHLVHHTMVDLRSLYLILRTLADLHFIKLKHPDVLERLLHRAAEFEITRSVTLATSLLELLENGSLNDLDQYASETETGVLLQTILLEQSDELSYAAWLHEYLSLPRPLLKKLGGLAALAFTSKAHLARTYHTQNSQRVFLYYPRRLFDLLWKSRWLIASPEKLRQIRRFSRVLEKQP